MATGRPLTSSNAPLATFAGRAHRCTAGRMSRTLGLALRPIGLGLGRCRSWLPSSCSQGGCCSLDARTSSVAKQTARKWRIAPYSGPRAQFGGVAPLRKVRNMCFRVRAFTECMLHAHVRVHAHVGLRRHKGP